MTCQSLIYPIVSPVAIFPSLRTAFLACNWPRVVPCDRGIGIPRPSQSVPIFHLTLFVPVSNHHHHNPPLLYPMASALLLTTVWLLTTAAVGQEPPGSNVGNLPFQLPLPLIHQKLKKDPYTGAWNVFTSIRNSFGSAYVTDDTSPLSEIPVASVNGTKLPSYDTVVRQSRSSLHEPASHHETFCFLHSTLLTSSSITMIPNSGRSPSDVRRGFDCGRGNADP